MGTGKKIINNTVLLPIFQYITMELTQYNFEEAIDHIDDFWDNDENRNDWEVIYACLKEYQKDSEMAKSFFEEHLAEEETCSLCLHCEHCISFFISEIYSILYDKKPNNIHGNAYYEFYSLPESIQKHIKTKTLAADYYQERHQRYIRQRSFNNSLVLLKGTSSSTPLVLNSAFDTQEFHGGGFYINWNGHGIAIDPGYHFSENFHNIGLDIMDLEAVVITHEHLDHSVDMRLLDDLIYNQKRFSSQNHTIRWYLDSVTYELAYTLHRNKSGFDERTSELIKINPQKSKAISRNRHGRNVEDISDGIILAQDDSSLVRMRVFPTEHSIKSDNEKTVFFNHTYGIILELEDNTGDKRKIFYSSDTKFSSLVAEYAKESNIVIANISSISEPDILRIESSKNHLGYMGCYGLLLAMKDKLPEYFLVSEFWNGKTDIRFDVCRYLHGSLTEQLGYDMVQSKILPSEIGMEIDIKNLSIKCDCCGKMSKDIKVIRPVQNNGRLLLCCEDCQY